MEENKPEQAGRNKYNDSKFVENSYASDTAKEEKEDSPESKKVKKIIELTDIDSSQEEPSLHAKLLLKDEDKKEPLAISQKKASPEEILLNKMNDTRPKPARASDHPSDLGEEFKKILEQEKNQKKETEQEKKPEAVCPEPAEIEKNYIPDISLTPSGDVFQKPAETASSPKTLISSRGKLNTWLFISAIGIISILLSASVIWNISLVNDTAEIKAKAISNAEIAKQMISEREKLASEYKPLKEENSKLTKELASIQNVTASLKKQNEELQTEVEKTGEKFKELQEKIKGYAREVKNLVTKKIGYYDAYSQQKEDNEILTVKIKKLDDEIKKLNGEMTEIYNTNSEREVSYIYEMAFLYAKAGMFDEAVQSFLKTLEVSETDADIHYNLALLYEEVKKDSQNAIRHYKKYLELNPDTEDLYEIKLRIDSLERNGSMPKYEFPNKPKNFNIDLSKLKY